MPRFSTNSFIPLHVQIQEQIRKLNGEGMEDDMMGMNATSNTTMLRRVFTNATANATMGGGMLRRTMNITANATIESEDEPTEALFTTVDDDYYYYENATVDDDDYFFDNVTFEDDDFENITADDDDFQKAKEDDNCKEVFLQVLMCA